MGETRVAVPDGRVARARAAPVATIEAEVARLEKTNKRNPLLMVPVPLAGSVNYFVSCNAHLVTDKGILAIATRVVWWVESEGLSHAGLKAAFRAVCRPDRQARHEHAGQLMADLAGEVDRILKAERQRERDDAFKAEMRKWEKDAVPADEVHAMIVAHREKFAGTGRRSA